MDKSNKTIDEEFLEKLEIEMNIEPELSDKEIYSIFSDENPKTILWRLHKLVQMRKLYKAGRGYYSNIKKKEHISAGYEYLQNTSKEIYNILIEYGYVSILLVWILWLVKYYIFQNDLQFW